VAKLNATGTALVYSTYLGGSGQEQGFGIAVDAAARPTSRASRIRVISPPLHRALHGAEGDPEQLHGGRLCDQVNATGTALVYSPTWREQHRHWRRHRGGCRGRAYVTGATNSADSHRRLHGPCMVLDGSFGGGFGDAFVTKLNATGTALVYSTYLGGSGYDSGFGIAVDAGGRGLCDGRNVLDRFHCRLHRPLHVLDATLAAHATPSWRSSTRRGRRSSTPPTWRSGDDVGVGIAVDAAGAAYVTGETFLD